MSGPVEIDISAPLEIKPASFTIGRPVLAQAGPFPIQELMYPNAERRELLDTFRLYGSQARRAYDFFSFVGAYSSASVTLALFPEDCSFEEAFALGRQLAGENNHVLGKVGEVPMYVTSYSDEVEYKERHEYHEKIYKRVRNREEAWEIVWPDGRAFLREKLCELGRNLSHSTARILNIGGGAGFEHQILARTGVQGVVGGVDIGLYSLDIALERAATAKMLPFLPILTNAAGLLQAGPREHASKTLGGDPDCIVCVNSFHQFQNDFGSYGGTWQTWIQRLSEWLSPQGTFFFADLYTDTSASEAQQKLADQIFQAKLAQQSVLNQKDFGSSSEEQITPQQFQIAMEDAGLKVIRNETRPTFEHSTLHNYLIEAVKA